MEMEKIDAGEGGIWGDDDIGFDLGLEKFGVDKVQLMEDPGVPKQKFHCWIEDWETPLLTKNDAVAEVKLLEKYRDLLFFNPDDNITYTAWNGNLDWCEGKGGGWVVLGVPPNWDGKDQNILEPFLIRHNIMGDMVKDTEQPKRNNVEVIIEPIDVEDMLE